jgi:tRNA uridine 5-carboxymethylaminomethyl modification enzyme
MDRLLIKQSGIEAIKYFCLNNYLEPADVNNYLESVSSATIVSKQKISQLILRPGVSLRQLIDLNQELKISCLPFDDEIIEQVEIQLKYQTYIDKENEMADKMIGLEEQVIPESFNYDKILSISNEARQKFNKVKPQTLGQASRISGVNPSDVQILMVYMGR